MKKAHLLSTVAAVLLLTGAASAQDVKKDAAPAPAPAAQQKAPAEKIAPAEHNAPALHSERKTPETTGQASPKEPDANKTEPTGKAQPMGKSEPHAAIKGSSDVHGSADVKSKEEHNAAENNKMAPAGKSATDKSATEEHRTTTGQGAAAGSAKLSTEQRTKISAVFRQHHVAPTHLNVSVSVGTRVPESVHFYPLPEEVVVIYPEWRGYDYILVGDQVLVIDPRTHEIVAILEA
jgi:hypothetical protein